MFTSGSTGKPKGVMLSHANAFTFLDWCHEALGPWRADDRFASHAPFHFDLSVFDLFASCRNAATLVLIGEVLGKDPIGLADFLARKRISVWYSSPSILSMLTQHDGLERHDIDPPRLVLFAGEVFPIAALRRLRAIWPRAAMWNLYGPTETNVCTAYPIPAVIPDDQTEAFPIGRVCKPLRARVVDESGRDVATGQSRGADRGGPRGHARLLRSARAHRGPLSSSTRTALAGTVPATWSTTQAMAVSTSMAVAIGWSRNAVIASSWERSSRLCIATMASTAPAWWPKRVRRGSRSRRSWP